MDDSVSGNSDATQMSSIQKTDPFTNEHIIFTQAFFLNFVGHFPNVSIKFYRSNGERNGKCIFKSFWETYFRPNDVLIQLSAEIINNIF